MVVFRYILIIILTYTINYSSCLKTSNFSDLSPLSLALLKFKPEDGAWAIHGIVSRGFRNETLFKVGDNRLMVVKVDANEEHHSYKTDSRLTLLIGCSPLYLLAILCVYVNIGEILIGPLDDAPRESDDLTEVTVVTPKRINTHQLYHPWSTLSDLSILNTTTVGVGRQGTGAKRNIPLSTIRNNMEYAFNPEYCRRIDDSSDSDSSSDNDCKIEQVEDCEYASSSQPFRPEFLIEALNPTPEFVMPDFNNNYIQEEIDNYDSTNNCFRQTTRNQRVGQMQQPYMEPISERRESLGQSD